MERSDIQDEFGGPSSERQILNREIQLIYKALRAEKESDSDESDSEQKGVEDGDSDEEQDIKPKLRDHGNNNSTCHDADGTEKEHSKVVDAASIMLQTEDGTLAATPETCLTLNRAYQEVLTDSVRRLRLVLAHNKARQSALEEEIETDLKYSSHKKAKQQASFSVPYFKDANGMLPPGNPDMLLKKLEYDQLEKQKRLWTDKDSQTLLEAIASDGLKRLLQPLMNKKEIEIDKLSSAPGAEEKAEIEQRISALNLEITRLEFLPKIELYGDINDVEILDKIDWMKISTLDFMGEFGETHLRQMWCTIVHPSVNRASWTAEEDQCLVKIANAYKLCNWAIIAEELNTGRTAFQCLQRYQTKLCPSLAMGRWLPEEDDYLKEMVENMMEEDKQVPWHQVAILMEGRSMEQCKKRWTRIKQETKRGRWTTDEDLKLLSAVHCYGKKWKRVQEFVPGRSMSQCRERWVNSMETNLKYGNWTYEEDRALILLVAKHGEGKWTAIAKQLPGRTDNMVIQRYRRLVSWQQMNNLLVSLPKQDLESVKGVSTARKGRQVELKVRRLLEQRRAEQRFRQQERHQDLTELGSQEPHEEPPEYNEIDQQEDAADDDDEATMTEAQLIRKRGNQLLEKLAKRSYAERMFNWEREQELIKQDMKDGIYVPRPPDTAATRGFCHVEKRRTMNTLIMEYVHETLKSTAKGQPEHVYQELSTHLRSLNMLKSQDEDEEEEEVRSVRGLLDKAQKERQAESSLHRQRAEEVEQKLIKAVRERPLHRPPGRPRKYLGGDSKLERSPAVENRICSLIMKTLNVDRVGTLLVSEAVKRANRGTCQQTSNKDSGNNADNITQMSAARKAQPSSSSSTHSGEVTDKATSEATGEATGKATSEAIIEATNGAIVEATGEATVEAPGEATVEANIEAPSQAIAESTGGISVEAPGESTSQTTDAAPPLKKGSRKRKRASGKTVSIAGCDECNTEIMLSIPTDDETQKTLEMLMRIEDPLAAARLPAPKLYRRSFVGMSEKIYNIPPLPPCTSTLNAFKTLLLNRRSLLKEAGNYYTGGTLGRLRPPGHPNCEATNENGGWTISHNSSSSDSAEGMQIENLNSSDLTPQMVKKLSIDFALKDIKEAKRILEQAEAQKRSQVNMKKPVGPEEENLQIDRADRRADGRWKVIEKCRNSHDYALLRARFQSLFLWPAMLSTFTTRGLERPSASASTTGATTETTTGATTEAAAAECVEATSPSRKRRRMPLTATARTRKLWVKRKEVKVESNP